MHVRSLALIPAVGAMLLSPSLARAADGAACMHTIDDDHGQAEDSETSVVVYLNARGGRIRAGHEDASNNRSRLVWGQNLSAINVPRYSGSSAGWDRIVGCVQKQFEDFNVKVVDERPTSGNFVMAMVGGSPSMLGYASYVAGVAPYNARVNDDAVVFVFEQVIHSERGVCESTAHEIGHALGLDHSRLCSDTMSYGSCGPKTFVDKAAYCGENGDRSCSSGAPRQNSYLRLTRGVGLKSKRRPSAPTARDPKPLPTPKKPPRQAPPASAPQISVLAAKRQGRANAFYEVKLRARGKGGIAGVELLWTDGQNAYSLRCGRRYNMPVKCTRRGDIYTFALKVGYGDRAFAIRAIDGRGKASMTKPRYARFR